MSTQPSFPRKKWERTSLTQRSPLAGFLGRSYGRTEMGIEMSRAMLRQARDAWHSLRFPLRCYVICAVARSGSNLLGDGLQATRRAGNPQQFFSHLNEASYAEQYRLAPLTDYRGYVHGIMKATATSNGVFGFKLMGWSLAMLLDKLRRSDQGGKNGTDLELVRAAFPRLRFIRISRGNRLRQAISKARAMQTGLWKMRPGQSPTGHAHFDPKLITQCLREEEIENTVWDRFFQEAAIRPFAVTYEQLCHDYRGTLRSVLEFLQIPLRRGMDIPSPQTMRQSDSLADEWERQYRAIVPNPTYD